MPFTSRNNAGRFKRGEKSGVRTSIGFSFDWLSKWGGIVLAIHMAQKHSQVLSAGKSGVRASIGFSFDWLTKWARLF